MKLHIQNNFTTELPADSSEINTPRQVEQACYSFVLPKKPSNPSLIHASIEVANSIGLSEEDIVSTNFLNTFSGNSIYPETKPFALSYAGHQFGNWAGQLGDGRAILAGEITNNDGKKKRNSMERCGRNSLFQTRRRKSRSKIIGKRIFDE